MGYLESVAVCGYFVNLNVAIYSTLSHENSYQIISPDVRNTTPTGSQRNNLFTHMTRQPDTLNFKFHKKLLIGGQVFRFPLDLWVEWVVTGNCTQLPLMSYPEINGTHIL